VPYSAINGRDNYALSGFKVFDFIDGVGVARTAWDCATGRIWAIK
jgi:hypothetical protein